MPRKAISLIIILLSLYAFGTTSNNNKTQLPWQKVFDDCDLPEYAVKIPCKVTHCDCFYHSNNMAGLWALTPPVAIKYGLTINNVKDERLDPQVAAVAAAQYMSDLTAFYRNEHLAILAYINTPALLNDVATANNLQLTDTTSEATITRLMEFLPNKWSETDIPEHAIDEMLHDSTIMHRNGVTITLRNPVRKTTLQETLNTSPQQFRSLNPAIVGSVEWLPVGITVYVTDTTALTTDFFSTETTEYENFVSQCRAEQTATDMAREKAIQTANAETIYHVKSGDTLGHIAKRYKVSVNQIKKWNNLRSDMIRVGQKLRIKQQ